MSSDRLMVDRLKIKMEDGEYIEMFFFLQKKKVEKSFKWEEFFFLYSILKLVLIENKVINQFKLIDC